jgi:Uma2 family endonuclease
MEALMTRQRDIVYESFPEDGIIYPESDGKPMSDNTKQYRWIVKIKEGLETLSEKKDVFIAADLFWYPVKGDNKTKTAPDVMVAIGRPKGDRRSYRQWEEGDIAPQVAFEILSQGNTDAEMKKKFDFYEKYGVQEYYIYDPDENEFEAWVRLGNRLRKIENTRIYTSLLLKIRFDMTGDELVIFRPDGEKFLSPLETDQQRRKEKKRARKEKERARKEKERAEKAEKEVRAERKRAEAERKKVLRLAEKLRELGIDPESL